VLSETNHAESQPLDYYNIRATTTLVSLSCSVTCG